MWGILGAVGGLLWGISKVLSATGRANGRIVFGVTMAVLFLVLLVFGTVAGGSF